MNEGTRSALKSDLAKIYSNEKFDVGLVNDLLNAPVVHMSKWIDLYLGQESSTPKPLIEANKLSPGWSDSITQFISSRNDQLNADKVDLIGDCSFLISAGTKTSELILVGDYHYTAQSSMSATIGDSQYFFKPRRHLQACDLYDKILTASEIPLPKTASIIKSSGTTWIAQIQVERFNLAECDKYSLGLFCILSAALNCVDMLKENVGLINGKPIFIDAECIFNPPSAGVKDFQYKDIAVMGMYRTGIWGYPNSKDVYDGIIPAGTELHNDSEFLKGINDGKSLLIKNKKAIQDVLTNTRNVRCRRIFRETSFYSRMLADLWHPTILMKEKTPDEILARLDNLPTHHPFSHIIEYEKSALCEGAIPVFSIDIYTGEIFSEIGNLKTGLAEAPSILQFNTVLDILENNSTSNLVSFLRHSLGERREWWNPDSTDFVKSLCAEVQSRLMNIANGKILLESVVLNGKGAGVQAVGPGILSGSGGVLLSLLDVCDVESNRSMFEDLFNYTLDAIAFVDEQDGCGLFIGPTSGLLAALIFADSNPEFRERVNHRAKEFITRIEDSLRNLKKTDLTHGLLGFCLAMQFISTFCWFDLKREATNLSKLNSSQLNKVVDDLCSSDYKGIAHGAMGLFLLDQEMIQLVDDAKRQIMASKIDFDVSYLLEKGQPKWCSGFQGIPMVSSDWELAGIRVSNRLIELTKLRQEYIIDSTNIIDFAPCHGRFSLASEGWSKESKNDIFKNYFTKPQDTPIGLAYGVGWSGIIHILLEYESWLVKICNHLARHKK